MKFCNVCILLVVAGVSGGQATTGHPVARVISLLEELADKAEAEGNDESLLYEKYEYTCGVNIKKLNKAIAEEEETIDELSDTIAAKTEAIATLSTEIDKLGDDMLAASASKSSQGGQRSSTNTLYLKTKKELEDTISAISSALTALEAAEKKTESGLTQVRQRVRSALALIQQHSGANPLKSAGDLAAHVDKYDFKSESVIELLKELETKFKSKLTDTIEAETNSLNAHSLSVLSLDNMVTAMDKSKGEKVAARTAAETALNTANRAKLATEGDKKADTESLVSTTAACETKKTEWDTRSKIRAEEISAIETAIKIMSKVTGVRTEAPANPIPPAAPALIQVAASPRHDVRRSGAVSRAINLLHATAMSEHSKMLEQMVAELSAKTNAPYDSYTFQPVINMIEKMIFQLQEEQKAEDDHKNWCDKELEKTKTMKEDKEDKINIADLSKKAEDAKVLTLIQEITDQNNFIASIKEYQAEITAIRKVGNKENKLALKDAQDAQAALADAIAVLTSFYKSSGMVEKEKWELIQEPTSLLPNPKTWEQSYTGVTDPTKPTGILAVLGEVAKCFADIESDTKSNEAADQQAYDEEMSKQDIDKARRTQDVEEKEMEKTQRLSEINDLASKLKHNRAELKETTQYLTDLQKACVDADSTYEARKEARAKEETALRGAEAILVEAFDVKPSGKFLQIRRH